MVHTSFKLFAKIVLETLLLHSPADIECSQ